MKKFIAIAAIALLAACGSGDDAAEGETVTADTTTTTVQGMDTITQPTVVPTTDTVTTTTTVTTDTAHGTATGTTTDTVQH